MATLRVAHAMGQHTGGYRPKSCTECWPAVSAPKTGHVEGVPHLVSCLEYQGCATPESLLEVASYVEARGVDAATVAAIRNGARSTDARIRAAATWTAQEMLGGL